MTNDTSICPWRLFDEHERDDIADQLHYIGGFSALMFIGLLLAYIHPTFETNRSYQNIGIFMLSAWLRRGTPFLMAYIIDRKDIYRREMPLCRLFGFFETFMAIHEVECLTHVCIERYVVSKYINNDWRMPNRHYYMFRLLSVFFAGTYSLAAVSELVGRYGYDFTCTCCTMDMILPVGWQKYAVTMVFVLRSIKPVGFIVCFADTYSLAAVSELVSRYGYDFTCTFCTMDMILPEGWQKYAVTMVFGLRSIKPVGFMIFMLRGAKQLEDKFVDVSYNLMQKKITDEVIALTAVNLACWAPIAMIQASAILSQHLYGSGVFSLPSPSVVKMALLLHWNSLACSTIALFLLNPKIRKAALNFRFQDLWELTSEPQKTE